MSTPRLSAISISAILAALTLSGASSSALSAGIASPIDSNPIVLQQSADDLQALQNRIQRQQFQQQQQQYRDQDRQIAPQPRLEVPQIKPSCQTQVLGTNFLSRCR